MKRFVVTGSTSFIGKNLIDELIKNGNEVFAVMRPESKNRASFVASENLHILELDMSQADKIKNYIDSCDFFVHLAWEGTTPLSRNDPEIQRRNVDNSVLALNQAINLNCSKFFFAGSQAEYGMHNEKQTELSACRPVSEDGKAKLAFGQKGAEICRDMGTEFIHLRIFSVYGVCDHHSSLINSCVSIFENGGVLETASLSQLWNYLHIRDLINQLLLLFELKEKPFDNNIINLASGDTRTLRDFVLRIFELSSKKGELVTDARPDNPEGTASLNPDISKLVKLTGWRQRVLFDDGVLEMLLQKRE
jgi:nucleoside-diphosphate-sugar epimerase